MGCKLDQNRSFVVTGSLQNQVGWISWAFDDILKQAIDRLATD